MPTYNQLEARFYGLEFGPAPSYNQLGVNFSDSTVIELEPGVIVPPTGNITLDLGGEEFITLPTTLAFVNSLTVTDGAVSFVGTTNLSFNPQVTTIIDNIESIGNLTTSINFTTQLNLDSPIVLASSIDFNLGLSIVELAGNLLTDLTFTTQASIAELVVASTDLSFLSELTITNQTENVTLLPIQFSLVSNLDKVRDYRSLSDEILRDNPLGYWPLQEVSGTQANDVSGNAYHGNYINSPTLDQLSLNPNKSTRKSVLFDGVSQYLTIPGLPQFSSGFTVRFSLRLSSITAGATVGLFGMDTDSIPMGTGNALNFDISRSGAGPQIIEFRFIRGSPSGLLAGVASEGKTGVHAYQCACITTNTRLIFIMEDEFDGSQNIIVQKHSLGILPNGSSDLVFAAKYSSDVVTDFSNIYLSDIAIWDTALPIGRVLAQNNTTVQGCKNLYSDPIAGIRVNGIPANREIYAIDNVTHRMVAMTNSNDPELGQFVLPVGIPSGELTVIVSNDPGDPGAGGTTLSVGGYNDVTAV